MDGFKVSILIDALPFLMQGLVMTIKISSGAFVLALLIGSAVGVARSESKTARFLLSPYVEVFRGTPLLIQLFFIYYGLPSIGITMDSITAGVLGLGLNGGAYISEIVRGSMFSVEKGQHEAAASLGLSWAQGMIHVIIPQAIRVALPPLVNAFSSLLKDSSLVSVLAITELTRVSQLIYTRTFRAFEVYLAVGILYFCIIFAVSVLSKQMEDKLDAAKNI